MTDPLAEVKYRLNRLKEFGFFCEGGYLADNCHFKEALKALDSLAVVGKEELRTFIIKQDNKCYASEITDALHTAGYIVLKAGGK